MQAEKEAGNGPGGGNVWELGQWGRQGAGTGAVGHGVGSVGRVQAWSRQDEGSRARGIWGSRKVEHWEHRQWGRQVASWGAGEVGWAGTCAIGRGQETGRV